MHKSHVDVLIVGAGISGIGAAYHLQKHCPTKSYAVIEARTAVGGTWDLFRYPGIRSDSDMYTFGFKFKPWVHEEAISPGELIKRYIRDAAREHGINQHIEFSSKVTSADWNSQTGLWKTLIKDTASGEIRYITSRFFFSCGGYFNYEHGHEPHFADSETFTGTIVHPQHWPDDLDYADKKIVIIGSGATAVTLAPTLAETASQVTLLQRSPTYIVSRPKKDKIASVLRRWLPANAAYALVRWKNILNGIFLYWFATRFPDKVKRVITKEIQADLGEDYDVAKHFTPAYNPWDQRICLVPDGDLFRAVAKGSVRMVTDQIERFTPEGILLTSGSHIDADIIISATGLKLDIFSGMRLSVDDQVVEANTSYCYKGMMLSQLPNMAFSVGYTNASWTLKSDLVGEYVCRMINHMDTHGFDFCVPKVPPGGIEATPLMTFTSGYIVRAQDQMPKQGKHKPWKLYQNYLLDRISLGLGKVNDSSMYFGRIASKPES